MARERAERENGASASPLRHPWPISDLRQLVNLLNSTDLEEIVVEHETSGLRLVLRKPPLPAAPAAEPEPAGLAELVESSAAESLAEAEKMIEVRAPLVGLFRSALKPTDSAAVVPGDVVRSGQVVGAIEALNVLNEIETPSPGRIKDVLVADGQAVEYGQLLLLIAPNAL